MSADKVRGAERTSSQKLPAHTEARGTMWEIRIKVSATGPRCRLKTWIPIKRDATDAPTNGADAARIYQVLEQLWANIEPRWAVLHALHKGQLGIYEVYETLTQRGLRGVDALVATQRIDAPKTKSPSPALAPGETPRTTTNVEKDLIELVEEWENSPLDTQNGTGKIKASTRRQMVSHVLHFISPELAAVRNTEALAHRDKKTLPLRPKITPFPWEKFTTANFKEHLRSKYRATPIDGQLEELKSSQPSVRRAAENALLGQGDGAFAAFNSLRVFARWLAHEHGIHCNPTDGLARPRPGRPSIIHLDNVADIELMAEGLSEPYNDIWRCMCGTGLEPAVGLSLTTKNVDVSTQEIIGLGTKNHNRKRRVECGPGAWQALKRAVGQAKAEKRESLWNKVDANGRQVDARNMARAVEVRRKELLSKGHEQFEGVTPSTGRHTFCVMALKGGATPHELAFQLGHRDASMVIKVYSLHIPKPGRIRAALSKR